MSHPLGISPSKIIAVHLNFRSRAAERGRAPEVPSYFLKPPSSLAADGDEIVRPAGAELLTYEGEIAAVIGTRARNAPRGRAAAHIGWFTASNDVGLHDLRAADRGSNLRSKGSDGFTPLGPSLVEAGRVDPTALRLRTWVNGRLVQDTGTHDMIFDFDYLVADLSRTITLEPGDVILTGTPTGSGIVTPGDVVEVELSGAGRLTNRIVAGPRLTSPGATPTVTDEARTIAGRPATQLPTPPTTPPTPAGTQPAPTGLKAAFAGTRPASASTEPGPADTRPEPAGAESGPVGIQPEPADTEPTSAGTPAPAGTRPVPAGTEPASAGTEPAPVDIQHESPGTRPGPAGSQPASASLRTEPANTRPASAGSRQEPPGTEPAPAGTPPASAGVGPVTERADGLRAETARALASVATATLSVQLRKRGLNEVFLAGLRPAHPTQRLLGRARTLRYLPLREDVFDRIGGGMNAQKRAVESLRPGDVLVIECRGESGAGTMGDILATRAQVLGATGIVTDGALRDTEAVRALDIPTYYGGSHASVLGRRHVPAEVDVPVACGGTLVEPGDVLVGDGDGVLVIPPALVDEVAAAALAQEREEEFVLAKVRAGASVDGWYPMNAAARAEYERTDPDHGKAI